MLNQCNGIKIDGYPPSHSHCLFVDDTLMFGSSSLTKARVIKKIITDYSSFSRKKVNDLKSKVFLLNVSPLVKNRLTQFWGFQVVPSLVST